MDLKLAKEHDPNLDIDRYLKKLAEYAQRSAAIAAGSTDPVVQFEAINKVLYEQEGYAYDMEAEEKEEPDFLHHLMDTKRGTCKSLMVLYLAVAQRLGYPIYPASGANHVFLRYMTSDKTYYNIEPTNKGASYSDFDYWHRLSDYVPSEAKANILRTMTYRRFLSYLVNTSAILFGNEEKQPEKAIIYLEKAIALNPKEPSFYKSMAEYHKALSLLRRDETAHAHLQMALDYAERGQEIESAMPWELPQGSSL